MVPMQGKSSPPKQHPGISVRRNADGTTGYQAHVWSARDSKRIRKTFPTVAAAKSWRRDALSALASGKMRAPSATTLREAAESWLEGAKAGIIRNRKEKLYKPSVLRGYEAGLNLHVLPALGARSVSEVERRDLKALL
jgi:hypothetical protein